MTPRDNQPKTLAENSQNSSDSSSFTKLPPINIKPKNQYMSGLPSKLPPGLTTEEDDPILKDWLISYRVPEIIRRRYPAEKYSFPCTTSSDIGWGWRPEAGKANFRTLEKFPMESAMKMDMKKWLAAARAAREASEKDSSAAGQKL
ncbi:hypothetical protein HDV05_003356 [Chytridiales sp. JEL 0842]|nr:hypothetical protein HDV05_003356 [Chytridiales sp. JEL 0842]